MADEIDPRYAPQFQRGFDAAQHVASPTRTGPVRLAGGPPPTAPRVPDPPPILEHPRVELPEEVVTESDEPAAPGHPRLEWAVLGIGVALILGAAGLFWESATDVSIFGGTYIDPAQYALLRLRGLLPGPLLAGGVLAVTAWLVVRAIGHRR
jgi:hypothetical protein